MSVSLTMRMWEWYTVETALASPDPLPRTDCPDRIVLVRGRVVVRGSNVEDRAARQYRRGVVRMPHS
jgi:hypothetical protein